MKRFLPILLVFFLATACNEDASSKKGNEKSTTENDSSALPTADSVDEGHAQFDYSWDFIREEDEHGDPKTTIVRIEINGTLHTVDTTMVAQEMDSSEWAIHSIPAEAIGAAGGWWAGAGDYYYILREENVVRVMYLWEDEMVADPVDPKELLLVEL